MISTQLSDCLLRPNMQHPPLADSALLQTQLSRSLVSFIHLVSFRPPIAIQLSHSTYQLLDKDNFSKHLFTEYKQNKQLKQDVLLMLMTKSSQARKSQEPNRGVQCTAHMPHFKLNFNTIFSSDCILTKSTFVF